jgi:integrase
VGAVVRGPARAPLRRRRPVLKPEQWPQLRREFHDYGPETQLLIDVAIDTGLRWGELTDLRAGHVVNRTPVYVKVETVVTWPGEQFSTSGDVVERKQYTKGAEDRRVDLGAAVALRLLEHIAAQRLAPDDLLFHANRIRAEHAAWRAGRDAEATAAWKAEWQTRLAAEPLPCERYLKTLPGGRVHTGEHAKASTYSLAAAARTARVPTPPTTALADRPFAKVRRRAVAGRNAEAGPSHERDGSARSGSAMSSGAQRCNGPGWSG